MTGLVDRERVEKPFNHDHVMLGARPSNRCDSHVASCCALTMSACDDIAALDGGVAPFEIHDPELRGGRPLIRRVGTASECCASCRPATTRLGPWPTRAARIAGSHAPA